MGTKAKKPAGPPPDPRFVHGVDTTNTEHVAVVPDTIPHANLMSTSSSTSHRHVVIQSGMLTDVTADQVRPIFLNLEKMWKWHWDIERVVVLDRGQTLSPFLPMALHHHQRVFFHSKSKNFASIPSSEPIEQKVIAVTHNSVTFVVKSRPPARNVQVTLSIEECGKDTKVCKNYTSSYVGCVCTFE